MTFENTGTSILTSGRVMLSLDWDVFDFVGDEYDFDATNDLIYQVDDDGTNFVAAGQSVICPGLHGYGTTAFADSLLTDAAREIEFNTPSNNVFPATPDDYHTRTIARLPDIILPGDKATVAFAISTGRAAPVMGFNTKLLAISRLKNSISDARNAYPGCTGAITIAKEATPEDGADFEFTSEFPLAVPPSFSLMWGSGVNGDSGPEQCTVSADCQNGVSDDQGGGFSAPRGVAIDSAGNVYVADTFKNRIQKFDSNGNFLRMWGEGVDGGSGPEICTVAANCQNGSSGSRLGGEFDNPRGVAVDGSGNAYVADTRNNRIQKFDGNGNFLRMWGSSVDGGSGPEICTVAADCQIGAVIGQQGGEFNNPVGVAVGCKVGTAGGLGGEFSSPRGVAVDTTGNVYVAGSSTNRVQKFSQSNFLLDDASPEEGDGVLQTLTVDGLNAGAYTVSETDHSPGFMLTNLVCDDGASATVSTVDLGNREATINLDPGETVTCTFTNVEQLDFGDAPAPYPTLLASDNGARHRVSTLRLGADVDTEADGQPDLSATGDDTDADGDDEDGVVFTSPLVAGVGATMNVTVAGTGGLLNAFVDFNQDGDWNDAGEQIFVDQPVNAGVNALTFTPPAASLPGNPMARFRLDSTGGLTPTGAAADGEVEDYLARLISTQADIRVTTTANPMPVIAGKMLVYTITVHNDGPSDARFVKVTNTLPAGVTLLSSNGCMNTPVVPTCELGIMAAGTMKSYTISVMVNAGTVGVITNQVTAASDTTDPDNGDNTATVDTTVFDMPSYTLGGANCFAANLNQALGIGWNQFGAFNVSTTPLFIVCAPERDQPGIKQFSAIGTVNATVTAFFDPGASGPVSCTWRVLDENVANKNFLVRAFTVVVNDPNPAGGGRRVAAGTVPISAADDAMSSDVWTTVVCALPLNTGVAEMSIDLK